MGWPAGAQPTTAEGTTVAAFAVDKRGALLVADDVGNVIWRVHPRQMANSS